MRASPPSLDDIYFALKGVRIEESPIVELFPTRRAIHGLCDHRLRIIYVSPHLDVCDTLIHECLHLTYPKWSERRIRKATHVLLNSMSSEEIVALFQHYESIKLPSRRVVEIP